jgi:uncharacterized membrane protein YdjX (TVP38/TMEM64 family)
MIPALIPTTPFNIGAGYLFNWTGFFVIFVGGIGGASIAFMISRKWCVPLSVCGHDQRRQHVLLVVGLVLVSCSVIYFRVL